MSIWLNQNYEGWDHLKLLIAMEEPSSVGGLLQMAAALGPIGDHKEWRKSAINEGLKSLGLSERQVRSEMISFCSKVETADHITIVIMLADVQDIPTTWVIEQLNRNDNFNPNLREAIAQYESCYILTTASTGMYWSEATIMQALKTAQVTSYLLQAFVDALSGWDFGQAHAEAKTIVAGKFAAFARSLKPKALKPIFDEEVFGLVGTDTNPEQIEAIAALFINYKEREISFLGKFLTCGYGLSSTKKWVQQRINELT